MRYYRLRLRRPGGRELVVTWAAASAREARREINAAYAPHWLAVEVVPKE